MVSSRECQTACLSDVHGPEFPVDARSHSTVGLHRGPVPPSLSSLLTVSKRRGVASNWRLCHGIVISEIIGEMLVAKQIVAPAVIVHTDHLMTSLIAKLIVKAKHDLLALAARTTRTQRRECGHAI